MQQNKAGMENRGHLFTTLWRGVKSGREMLVDLRNTGRLSFVASESREGKIQNIWSSASEKRSQ